MFYFYTQILVQSRIVQMSAAGYSELVQKSAQLDNLSGQQQT